MGAVSVVVGRSCGFSEGNGVRFDYVSSGKGLRYSDIQLLIYSDEELSRQRNTIL